MNKKHKRIHIGLRTIKTAIAVMLAMVTVDLFGASTSKLIFAMLGAMDAVQPTVKASLRACLTQVVGVLLGAVIGILLLYAPLNQVIAAGIGIVVVITLYTTLGVPFSPGLPCLIVVTMCTTPNIAPMTYAFGRIWDSMIGLGIGTVINAMIFPYDNSRQIRATAESLDRELIHFLEELFDGDDVIPEANDMAKWVTTMGRQLEVFSGQWSIRGRKRHQKQLESFELYTRKARELYARMTILSCMEKPGRLSPENRQRLADCGAAIRDQRPLEDPQERDIVTNYHVTQILRLREELLNVLR